MGRKGKWFGAVKKVFSPASKRKKSEEKRPQNIKKSVKWGGIEEHKDSSDPSSSQSFENSLPDSAPPPRPQPRREDVKLGAAESEHHKHSHSVGIESATTAGSTASVSQAAEAVIPCAVPPRFFGMSREEIAATRIQTAFRGYLARRALRALRGLVRLKSLIQGNACKRQATTTLRCMQTLARVQSQIRSRRIRISEENQALQRQLMLKREKELESLRMGEEWDDSLQSKEQIEASLQSKQEAALRRERALAYAFTHQGKNSSKSVNPMFMDPNNPQWGWSWMERWMAARPWESRSTTSTTDRDLNSDRASVKSVATLSVTTGREITKAYARRDSQLSPLAPLSKKALPKINSAGPKMTGWTPAEDDDMRSMLSVKSERRRHSIAGSSAGDDESLASSAAVPSYMAPTRSARARSRFQSPSNNVVIEGLEKVAAVSAKKKLSFPGGPVGPRRHSGPPRVDLGSVKDVAVSVGEQ